MLLILVDEIKTFVGRKDASLFVNLSAQLFVIRILVLLFIISYYSFEFSSLKVHWVVRTFILKCRRCVRVSNTSAYVYNSENKRELDCFGGLVTDIICYEASNKPEKTDSFVGFSSYVGVLG